MELLLVNTRNTHKIWITLTEGLRFNNDQIDAKEKVILSRDQDLQSLSDKYIILEGDFDKRSSEFKTLKEQFDLLTLQLRKMKSNAEILSKKLEESEKKGIVAEKELKSLKEADMKFKDKFKESESKIKIKNDEEKMEDKLKDTDTNVDAEAEEESNMNMLNSQVKNADSQFDFAPDRKDNAKQGVLSEPENIGEKRMSRNTDKQFDFAPDIKENAKPGVLAEPENIGDKKLSRREDVESAASSVEREAVSENIGHESSSTGALDQRYVNSMSEKSSVDANQTDSDFHGINESVVIG